MEEQLRLLSPESVLSRGYSITLNAATRGIVRAALDVEGGMEIRTLLAAGEILSVVRMPGNIASAPGLEPLGNDNRAPDLGTRP